MHLKPKIKCTYDTYTANERVLVLHDEREPIVIQGELFAKLAPLLDGTNTLSTILEKLGSTASSPQVFFALQQLASRGITVEGADQPDHASAGLLEQFGGWSGSTIERLAGLSIAVQSIGEWPGGDVADSIASALERNGMTVTRGGDGDFAVVATDDYLQPELAAINRAALAAGRPWMLVKPIGKELWIGPIFQPGTTGCWGCMAHRLRTNRQVEGFIQKNLGRDTLLVTARAWLPATVDLAAGLTANEVLKWAVSPTTSAVLGTLRSFDVVSREAREHTLIKRPQCLDCGQEPTADASRARAPAFESRIKKFTADGGHRTTTPEQTYERYKKHISPILGVVSELRPMYGPAIQLAPAYVAGHNFAMGTYNLEFLRESLRGASGGKGMSDIQAKVSGLCEAIERFSGNYDHDKAAVRGTYAELAPRAIHPNACMGFSEEQYQQRSVPHPVAPKSRCVLVPNRFDESRELDWTELWSLTGEGARLLP
ncbi:MAG: TOMM precursor leader peptide-binding protein, partial [Myxococcota bacterium]